MDRNLDETHPPDIDVVAGVVVEAGRVLVARRTSSQRYPLLWEFPGGKVEPGETPEEALDREFAEELGVRVQAIGGYGEIRYRADSGRWIHVRFHLARRTGGEPAPLEVDAVEWAGKDRLEALDFVPADRGILVRVLEDLDAGRL